MRIYRTFLHPRLVARLLGRAGVDAPRAASGARGTVAPSIAWVGVAMSAALSVGCVDLDAPGACAPGSLACEAADAQTSTDTSLEVDSEADGADSGDEGGASEADVPDSGSSDSGADTSIGPDATDATAADAVADATGADAADADAADADACAAIKCDMPPGATCASATTKRTYASSGTCSAGSCSYASTDVACDMPPAASCANTTTKRTYASTGTCSGGVCSYAPTDTACNTPPATTCANATTKRTFPAGACTAGACTYAPSDTPCNTPPAATCVNSTTRRTYSSAGTCSGGVCSYTSTDVACATGDFCKSGVCAPPPSCAGGLTCGTGSGMSCCNSSVVTGGTIKMGRAATGPEQDVCSTWAADGCDANEQPEREVIVDDFRLDTFEVTVGRFRRFVAAYPGNKPAVGAGAHPKIAGSGWQASWDAGLATDQAALIAGVKCGGATWRDVSGNESAPMNCVDWYTAFAFCAWDGGRLPTEAEWEYAAAAGLESRVSPWGNTAPDSTLASYGGALFDVGSKPAGAGKWGQLDLAGSLWEWNLDWLNAYPSPASTTPCDNCANLTSGSDRVLKGGSYAQSASFVRAAKRGVGPPGIHWVFFGLRCARPVNP